MVKAIDNIITGAPLRDIRLAIGPAEALLQDSDRSEEPAEPPLEDQLRELPLHDTAKVQTGSAVDLAC